MSADNTQIDLREKRRQELAEVNFQHGAQGGALMNPQTGRELMDMANMMSGSGQMIRDFYRGNAGDCAALIMICQPYGFNPFMVSWKTYKASKNADAPISFEGQLVNAMVNMSAPVKGRLQYAFEGEGAARRCTVTGIDRETGAEIVYTSPQVGSIPTKNSPLWKADPDQQLGYYSARAWARRHFPELLLGIYTREEIEEAPIRDVTPGGFAQKAVAARAAASESAPEASHSPEVPDAEVLPPDTAKPLYASLDADSGFPGSDAWDRGVADAQDGKGIEDCPYDIDIAEAVDWCGGWRRHQA